MKKSILSLSAVALAGMFVASSASAVAIFDYNQARIYAPYRVAKMGAAVLPAGTGATKLEQHPAGTGHILLTPYYNAQGSNATLINIVNTDNYNGKAVKVRFRGASNSDDIMDFTVLLSPGDVWSGNISQHGGINGTGLAQLSMSPDDVSCMFPAAETFPQDFVTGRLDNLNQPADVKAALTREGYVEVLNMADIPPFKSDGVTVNPLYTSIKHVNGTAPCAGALYNALFNTNEINLQGDERSYIDQTGLAFPTGNLMGSWTIMNQAQQGSFSGAQTAMIATTADMGVNGTVTTTAAGIAFSPQRQLTFGGVSNASEIDLRTADPILVTGDATVATGGPNNAVSKPTGATTGGSIETPLWFDLPDLSTPILFDLDSTAHAPTDQVNRLTRTLTKTNVQNEWIASNAGVQFDTDWVISQPTRRYHVAVDYANSRLVFGTVSPTVAANRFIGYDPVKLTTTTGIGPVACMDYGLLLGDRQETFATQGPVISPGTVKPTCGEVFTMQFTGTSTLNASITATSFNDVIRPLLASGAGWGQLSMTGAGGIEGLPTLGFAAIQFSRNDTGAIYNMTFPHRWATGTIDSQ
jgi:hypothetical protein